MKNINKLIISVGLFSIAFLSACGSGGGGSNNTNPNRGFDLLASRIEVSATTGSEIIRPTNMRVQGQFLEQQGTIRGTIEQFSATDIGPGPRNFPGTKVPARWRFTYVEVGQIGRIPCQEGIITVERNVGVGALEELFCSARVFPIVVSPNAINGQAPPAKIDIQVEGLSNEFNVPQIAILNEFGQLKAAIPATIMNLGKGQIQIDTPNLSQYSNGVYSVTISNVKANGAWDVVGGTEITIYGNPVPQPPNYPDPCNIPAPCLY